LRVEVPGFVVWGSRVEGNPRAIRHALHGRPRFRVSGFGFRISGSGFRVQDAGFGAGLGFGLGVYRTPSAMTCTDGVMSPPSVPSTCLRFRDSVSGFGFRVSVSGFKFRFRVSDFGFQVSKFGFRVSGRRLPWCPESGSGFWVSGFGIWNPAFRLCHSLFCLNNVGRPGAFPL